MKKILFIISVLFVFSSCTIISTRILSPGQMLRTGPGFKYSEFLASDSVQEYKIAVNDQISFSLSTNNGESIIDPVGGSSGGGTSSSFNVEFDGTIRLPVIGRIKINGYTLREAEKLLEETYSKFYNNPFVQLKVTNIRIFLFTGGENGSASVMSLANPNTTLFEALASNGGVGNGKAYKIKLIRGDLKNPKVYLIDLSTLEGMKKANLVLQANDIIYIKPRNKVQERLMTFITPYISMVSFILLINQTFK